MGPVTAGDDATDHAPIAESTAPPDGAARFFVKPNKPYDQKSDEERDAFVMALVGGLQNWAQDRVTDPETEAEVMERVTARFDAAISALADGGRLIIECTGDDTGRFVQMTHFGEVLRLESVGNRYLSRANRLTPTHIERLRTLGWNDPDDGGNHWLEFEPPIPCEEAARLALRTMMDVHDALGPGHLEVTGSPAILQSLEEPDEPDEPYEPEVQLNPAMNEPFRYFAMTSGNETFGLSRLNTKRMLGERFNPIDRGWEQAQDHHGWVIDILTGRAFDGYEVDAAEAQQLLDWLVARHTL